MFLRLLSREPSPGLEVLIPVLILGLEHPHVVIAALMEDLRQPSAGLDPCRVMIQAEADSAEVGIPLQHPEHGVFAGPTEGHEAVFLPASGITGKEGQQVDGRLEYIEPVAGAGVVEAAPGVAALHVDSEGPAKAVEAALVRVTGNAVLVLPDENGVVILFTIESLTALIDQPRPDEGGDHIPVQEAVLEQIGVHSAHLPAGGGQGKLFP